MDSESVGAPCDHDWKTGHIVFTKGTGPPDEEGNPTLLVGDVVETFEARMCEKCQTIESNPYE